MTVSPHTMDVLYRNGTIDYIPYDLMGNQGGVLVYKNNPPVSNPKKAPKGPVGYNYQKDAYVTSASTGSVALNNLGVSVSEQEVVDIKEYKKALKEGSEKNTNVFKNKKQLWKGLASIGILGTTVFLLLKGKKVPDLGEKIKSFFKKLNPLNWFKKS